MVFNSVCNFAFNEGLCHSRTRPFRPKCERRPDFATTTDGLQSQCSPIRRFGANFHKIATARIFLTFPKDTRAFLVLFCAKRVLFLDGLWTSPPHLRELTRITSQYHTGLSGSSILCILYGVDQDWLEL